MVPKAAFPSPTLAARTTRMLDGKEDVVGVAGRTLTLLWGLRPSFMFVEVVGLARDVDCELVLEALECEWWWWMLRMEETDEEVDLRPRRPAELRLYDECGVNGDGESDGRFPALAPAVVAVDTKGR
jgi:hypothetical protein